MNVPKIDMTLNSVHMLPTVYKVSAYKQPHPCTVADRRARVPYPMTKCLLALFDLFGAVSRVWGQMMRGMVGGSNCSDTQQPL